ncbi:MAG: rod shape-determining protein RodA [Candidatus Latescibacterota bacterium]|nr:rod shape-determining protein RodA [Candidatus Latescibacterota bacterium]
MRIFRELDLLLLAATLVTMLLGVMMIYSAAFHSDSTVVQTAWDRQAKFAFFSLAMALAIVSIPDKVIYGIAHPLYLFGLLSLLAVLAWGTGDDAARWLRLGPLRLQPSELAKITTIIALARYLSDCSTEQVNAPRGFLGALCLSLVPMALIVRQPDLGTAISFGAPLFPMLYWAGMRKLFIFLVISPILGVVCSFEPLWQSAAPYIFATFIIGSTAAIHLLLGRLWLTITTMGVNLSAGLITVYLWDNLLRQYQKDRIMTFLDPESDRLGSGWNIIQSKIAIGSGGLTGKGFLEGTQTKYEFLPAAHTDFIFSVVGEELGFIGALVVLALFFFLIARALHIGSMVKNRFYSLIAIGLAAMLTFHVFVNIGMTIGVMPVTGLPLPFLSSGGSSLFSNLIAIGLLLHIYTYRHEY